jgi:hypothetical protein
MWHSQLLGNPRVVDALKTLAHAKEEPQCHFLRRWMNFVLLAIRLITTRTAEDAERQ